MADSTELEASFTNMTTGYSVVFVDNARVAYAYLLDLQANIAWTCGYIIAVKPRVNRNGRFARERLLPIRQISRRITSAINPWMKCRLLMFDGEKTISIMSMCRY